MLCWLRKLFCHPKLKWIGYGFIAIGIVLLIIFVPVKFWFAILGMLLIVLGILILSI